MSRHDTLQNVLDLELSLSTTDYQISIALREAGFPQWPWTCYWVVPAPEEPPQLHHVFSPVLETYCNTGVDPDLHDIIAAPTFSVLETLLTDEWEWRNLGDLPDHQLLLYVRRVGRRWSADYRSLTVPSDQPEFQHFGAVSDTPVNVVAGLIIAATRKHPSFMQAIAARWGMVEGLSDVRNMEAGGGWPTDGEEGERR